MNDSWDRLLLATLWLFMALLIFGCAPVVPVAPAVQMEADRIVSTVGMVAIQIQAGCREAQPLLRLGSFVPQGAAIAEGVEVLCAGDAAIEAAAADPSTPLWLGQQIQMLRNLAPKARLLRS